MLNNQADRLLREADYPRALAVSEQAVRAAERGAPPGLRANSAYNAGEALTWLGRYDEAIQRFEDSLRICHEAGLRRTAMPLRGLAEAHGLRGQREQSRAAYEEAIGAARATDEPPAALRASWSVSPGCSSTAVTRRSARRGRPLTRRGAASR